MDARIIELNRRIEEESQFTRALVEEIRRAIVGQDHMVERLIVGLLAGGHVLLEGGPGLAKTLTVHTLARAIDAGFQRIQFTPDLLPADLIGTLVYDPRGGTFTPRKGPIFGHIILADEINRAPAKVQSALLEAMQEHQVTIGDTTYPLDEPFLVLATQNPIEQEGTYPLPEAQVDRFMLKLEVTYPSKEEERRVLELMGVDQPIEISAIVHPDQILSARNTVNEVYVDDKVKDYIVDLVQATRSPDEYGIEISRLVEYGASPRATLYLLRAARALAFLRGRGYVTPEDIKSVAPDVLRHRVIVTYEAEAEEIDAAAIVGRVLDEVPVP
ncbi:MAG: ATPase [Gemmatimonadetes bacterium]|nr:ATPase [Gemmatimonadota bacterium]